MSSDDEQERGVRKPSRAPSPEAGENGGSPVRETDRERVLAQARLLFELRTRAARSYASRPPRRYDGFAQLLDEFLPEEGEKLAATAALVRLPALTLRELRQGTIPASDVTPPECIVFLAKVMELDSDTTLELVRRDIERLRRENAEGGLAPEWLVPSGPRVPDDEEDGLLDLRQAWQRVQRQDELEGW